MTKELFFRMDTKHRKDYFTGISWSHPAKMSLPLQIWLIDNFTKPGDTILDPMAGSGTVLVACSLGRHVIAVDLESKFCDMARGNWAKIQQRGPQMGYSMGTATILQGDARQLTTLLKGQVGAILTSPPYAEAQSGGGISAAMRGEGNYKVTTKLPGSCYQPSEHGDSEGQIGQLPYKPIDCILTSPPYEGSLETGSRHTKGGIVDRDKKLAQTGTYADLGKPSVVAGLSGYSEAPNNIGNLKADNYLASMKLVYEQCHRVLKPDGVMALVLKNFIRDQKLVRLDLDTTRIVESVGFVLNETLKRRLPAQSFWRILYKRRFPDAPTIDFEDVLVFTKAVEGVQVEL